MRVQQLENFPENCNPFDHDAFHMGTRLGTNCVVMFPNHEHKECPFLIVVNTTTGERLKVFLEEIPEEEQTIFGTRIENKQ